MKRIGFSATYGFCSIEDAVIYAYKNGFSAIEINLNIPEFFPERYDNIKINKIKEILVKNNIVISFHAPEDINLCTKQNNILDASIKTLKESIDFACKLGGARFTFHTGDSVNFTMFDRNLRMEEYYSEDYKTILYNAMKELCSYSSGRIILCMENTGYFSKVKTEAAESLLGKGLYLTWDIGHSFAKKEQQQYMEQHIDFIRNVHIHDVSNGKDHCILGTGELNIQHYLSLLSNKDINYIIEVRPADAALKSLKCLKKIIDTQQ